MEIRTWFAFFILLIIFYIFRTRLLKRGSTETSSGAIVMALGIFLNGAAYRFPSLDPWGAIFSLGLFLVWLFISAPFIKSAVQKDLKNQHLSHPIQSFAAGTWIAGTSVCAIAIANRLPEWEWLACAMAIFAFLLWLYYIRLTVGNFQKIRKFGLDRKVNGIVLLTTVSTQSLVVLYKTLYNQIIPDWVYGGMISIGILFYFFGFYLIVKRYVLERTWNIVDEWPNTNCIVHGAMSITGLASAVSGALSPDVNLVIWFWALLWFLIIESMECWRAAARIRSYGWRKGIGLYHVTQWSRKFTFGMLYAFTLFFDLTKTSLAGIEWLHTMRNMILDYGAWVVLVLLVNECLLFMKENMAVGKNILDRKKGMNLSRHQ